MTSYEHSSFIIRNSLFNHFHRQLSRNFHAAANATGDGAEIGVEAVNALGSFAVFGGQFELIGHVDAPQNEDVAIFADIAAYIGGQITFTRRNLTRFQRAAKGSSQSATCGRNYIVNRRSVGIVDVGIDLVMLGNL